MLNIALQIELFLMFMTAELSSSLEFCDVLHPC